MRTPQAILSYPVLYTPEPFEEGDKPAWSAALIFTVEAQATPEFTAMKEAARDAVVETWGDKAAEIIQGMKYPLFRTDGEAKGYPEGSVYINARAKTNRPGVVSNIRDSETGKKHKITEEEAGELGGLYEVFPGALVMAGVGAFTYATKGNKGVSFGLNNVMVIYQPGDDRVRLAGGIPAEDEFDEDADAVVDLEALTEEQEDTGDATAAAEGEEVPETPAPAKKPAKKKAAAKKKKAAAATGERKPVDLTGLF